jgi:hypothetical protein
MTERTESDSIVVVVEEEEDVEGDGMIQLTIDSTMSSATDNFDDAFLLTDVTMEFRRCC